MNVSLEAKGPSPQTTLVVLLGASAWPLSPEFQSSEAFAKAARRLKAYFLNPQPFGLPKENLLDLFDSEKSADELDERINQYLEERLAAMRKAGNEARDLIVYFIGHGGFVGHDADLYLAIRRTRMSNPRISGIHMLALADTLRENARHLRRIIVLDCCFAAAAFSAFQSGPDEVAVQKTVTAFLVNSKSAGFPTKGTSLLCSSSQKSPSLLLSDNSSTMFTKAFIDALLQGTSSRKSRLSLRDVKDIAMDRLYEMQNAPKPVVLSPDQSEGDIADIPFFPNPRVEQMRRAEEEARAGQVDKEQASQLSRVQRQPQDPSPPLPNKKGRRTGLIITILILILVLGSGGVLAATTLAKKVNVSSSTPTAAVTSTSVTLFTSVADFTVSPPASNNITLVRNDSKFQSKYSNSILGNSGQVVADFNLQASMKTVNVTIRGLVSRNEPSKGSAPISLLYNDTPFLQDFSEPGEGFDPNSTTFQVPVRLLTPGTETGKLTLQVAPDAQTNFWLYRLEIQQSA